MKEFFGEKKTSQSMQILFLEREDEEEEKSFSCESGVFSSTTISRRESKSVWKSSIPAGGTLHNLKQPGHLIFSVGGKALERESKHGRQ